MEVLKMGKLNILTPLLMSLLSVAAIMCLAFLAYAINWRVYGLGFIDELVPRSIHLFIDFSGWTLFAAIALSFPYWLAMACRKYCCYKLTPLQAAVSFFIPWINLWRPYQTIMCIWLFGVGPDQSLSNHRFKQFAFVWWLSWLFLLTGVLVYFGYMAAGLCFLHLQHYLLFHFATFMLYFSAFFFCVTSVFVVAMIRRRYEYTIINPKALRGCNF